jgi:hypothetical protein
MTGSPRPWGFPAACLNARDSVPEARFQASARSATPWTLARAQAERAGAHPVPLMTIRYMTYTYRYYMGSCAARIRGRLA